MKSILIILAIIFTSIATAQEPCQEFLDKMAESSENKKLKNAEIFMKGFLDCKEENHADSKILQNLKTISYILYKTQNLTIVKLLDYKIAIMNSNFEIIHIFQDTQLNYVDVTNDLIRMFKYTKNGRGEYYLYDLKGKVLTKGLDYIDKFKENYSVYVDNKKGANGYYQTGYIDNSANLKYLEKYHMVFPFQNNRAVVVLRKDFKYSFIDENFKEKLKNPIELHFFSPFFDGYAVITYKNGKQATIDTFGNIKVISKNIGIVTPFVGGVAIAKSELNGKFGLIDLEFNEITGFLYDKLNSTYNFSRALECTDPFCNYMSAFYDYTYNGEISKKNNIINFEKFNVQKDGKSFSIDKKGNVIN